MEDWEKTLSETEDGAEAPPQTVPSFDEAQDSLFIVEGLSESEAAEPQIFTVETPAPAEPEEEALPLEMAAVSVDLGGAAAEEATEQPEGAVGEEEAVATGAPRYLIYGSIAAGLVCLLTFGGLLLKKPEPDRAAVAAAPAKDRAPKPAPAAPAVEEGEEEVPPTGPSMGAMVGGAVIGLLADAMVPDEPAPEPPASETPLAEAPASPLDGLVSPMDAPAAKSSAEEAGPQEPVFKRGEAILQLKNGSLFPGKIMKVMDKGIVLRVADGEIYFDKLEIAKVLPPGAKGLENYPNGYVDLENGNRIWGTIVDQGESSVTVASSIAKIILSRETVQKVKVGPGYAIVE